MTTKQIPISNPPPKFLDLKIRRQLILDTQENFKRVQLNNLILTEKTNDYI